MIEKTMHYVWLGSRAFPEKYTENIRGWRKLHPDWKIVKWNEENFDCDSNPWIKRAISQKNYSLAADVIRSYVLLHYGGVYLDTDIELVKPLDALAENYDFFIGYETGLWFGCAVLGAKKGHKIMREVYKRYETSCDEINKSSNMLCVLNFSACIKRLYGVKLNGKTEEIEDNAFLLSSDCFFPKHYITDKTTVTENTVAIHQYSATWHPKGKLVGKKVAKVARAVLGKRVFSCFERIARINMLNKLQKEYEKRSDSA